MASRKGWGWMENSMEHSMDHSIEQSTGFSIEHSILGCHGMADGQNWMEWHGSRHGLAMGWHELAAAMGWHELAAGWHGLGWMG